MAVRLHMKLGVVAEPDRLPDSPDTVVVVEPSVGSVARSKGNLYLLVTANGTSNRIHDATRLAAETIRNEYYYDESAGIRGCLAKAIGLANKRLAHLRDRLGMHERDIAGPIGIGLAVVRGSELYVATVGPAEAYLIRQARLSTLPDPHRERGLPSRELEPDVWRGEISVGDSLVIVSANVMSRIGPDELKDAMVTLHPQSAMEHLHHRFITNGGSGNDGAIAIEATEVAATQKSRSLVPVRPAEPLAGTPERSPIPLADSVTDGVAAMQAGAHQARVAAGGVFERGVRRLLDLLPERNTAYRRVTPLASRREAQRRAAVALLAFVLVVGGLGVGVFLAASGTPRAPLRSVSAAQAALDLARADIAKVWGPGVDLVVRDREEAERLLTEAYAELDKAENAGISSVTIASLRSRVVAGLDQLYGVVDVDPAVVFSFETADPPVDLAALVKGPDDAAYVLDRTSKAVFRVDFNAAAAANIVRPGQKASGTTVSEPQLLGAGGPDLLVLDSENILWRWRPANRAGRGTIARIQVTGAASWGPDIPAFGTYLRNPDTGLYNLYVVNPGVEQILAHPPSADGSGFPAVTNWFKAPRPLTGVSSLYIDGDIYVADAGAVTRFSSGSPNDWEPDPPVDELLRPAPVYSLMASYSDKRTGRLYAYDQPNSRIVAIDKDTGDYIEQYRLAGDAITWTDIRGMYVVPGVDDAPATLLWIDGNRLYQALLTQSASTASPAPSTDPSASPGTSPPAVPESLAPSAAPAGAPAP